MMAERGVKVACSTILRCVTRSVSELEKRWNRYAKVVGTSRRVDETYVSIKAKWHSLYRAVDKHCKSVHFFLRCDRTIAASVKVRPMNISTTWLSKIIRRSSNASRRRQPSTPSRTRPFRLMPSKLPTAFARGNSLLVVVVGAMAGREKRNGRWHSHNSGVETQNASGPPTYSAMHQCRQITPRQDRGAGDS